MKLSRSKYLFGILLLMAVFAFSSCKSKKKATEISDAQEIKDEMAEESTEVEEVEEEPEEISTPVKPVKKDAPDQLDTFFEAVANAPSPASANKSISDALLMFDNPNAPVLIVIYSSGGQVDYDEPTTIKKYLEYLKDTKNYNVEVEEIVRSDNGKIKELVLRKK
jgi:hypothetical protein